MSENETDQKAEVPAGCARQRQGWKLSCSAFAALLRSTPLCHTQLVPQPVAALFLSFPTANGKAHS